MTSSERNEGPEFGQEGRDGSAVVGSAASFQLTDPLSDTGRVGGTVVCPSRGVHIISRDSEVPAVLRHGADSPRQFIQKIPPGTWV